MLNWILWIVLVIQIAPSNAIVPDHLIKAATYFARDNPLNFWESVTEKGIEEDLEKIANDGFNTVLLVLTWTGIQTNIAPDITYDHWYLDRIKFIVKTAESKKLDVIGRIGYPHFFASGSQYSGTELCDMFMSKNPLVIDAWKDYVRKINEVARDVSERYLYTFFSWEDFMCVFYYNNKPPGERLTLAKSTLFQNFLEDRFDSDFNKARAQLFLNEALTNFKEVMIPKDGTEEPELFVLWQEYMNILWWDLLVESRKVVDDVSMEVRYDGARVVQRGTGREMWNKNDRHDEEAFHTSALRGVYYVPHYMLPRERGSDSDQVRISLRNWLNFVPQPRTVVLEQFNFRDNTPGLSDSAAYIEHTFLTHFIIGSASLFQKSSAGYGVWAYRNYCQNVLYNGFFERELRGWQVKGTYSFITDIEQNGKIMKLQQENSEDAVLSSTFDIPRTSDDADKTFNLCFYFGVSLPGTLADTGETAIVEVFLNGDVIASYSGHQQYGEVCAKQNINQARTKSSDEKALVEVHVKGGQVYLGRFRAFGHVHDLGIYNEHGRKDFLHEAVVQLNDYIDLYEADELLENLDPASRLARLMFTVKVMHATLESTEMLLVIHFMNTDHIGQPLNSDDVRVCCTSGHSKGSCAGCSSMHTLKTFNGTPAKMVIGSAVGLDFLDLHPLDISATFLSVFIEPVTWVIGAYFNSLSTLNIIAWFDANKGHLLYPKKVFSMYLDPYDLEDDEFDHFKEHMSKNCLVLLHEFPAKSIELLRTVTGGEDLKLKIKETPRTQLDRISQSEKDYIAHQLKDLYRAYSFATVLFDLHLREAGLGSIFSDSD